MARTAPADADDVLLGLRLGWAMAEVRGRLHNGSSEPAPKRPDRALPLADERGWTEETIESREVLAHLAEGLKVDLELHGGGGERPTQAVRRLAVELDDARADHDDARIRVTWSNTAELFYKWDARIQDTLAARSFTVASAYQLGRGLAEIYWMLDPDVLDSTNPRSALCLLGGVRQQAFARLLPRLTAYFPESASAAVAASVLAWADAAKSGLVKKEPSVVDALHEQLRVWHDLLLVGQPPEARVPAKDLVTRARRVGPVLRAFVPEVGIGLLSLITAGAAAALFALGKGNAAVAPVLSVFSVFGITGAGALAKAKGEAHALFDRLGTAMDADAIKEAVTLPPARVYLDLAKTHNPLAAPTEERGLKELQASLDQSPLAPVG